MPLAGAAFKEPEVHPNEGARHGTQARRGETQRAACVKGSAGGPPQQGKPPTPAYTLSHARAHTLTHMCARGHRFRSCTVHELDLLKRSRRPSAACSSAERAHVGGGPLTAERGPAVGPPDMWAHRGATHTSRTLR